MSEQEYNFMTKQNLSTKFCQEFNLNLGYIFKIKIGQYFAADASLRLWSLILVTILKLCLAKILKFEFSQNANVWLRF